MQKVHALSIPFSLYYYYYYFLGSNISVTMISKLIFINLIIICSAHTAPECVMHGIFSAQSDVYSFGILILEIVTGKRNECSNQPEHAENLRSNVSMGALM